MIHDDLSGCGSSPPVHIVPVRILLVAWSVLVVLTVATIAAVYVDLGRMNLWLAMVIATVKASLVALYFMHLRYDRPFNAVVFVSALIFVMLFVGVTLMDTVHYQVEIIPGQAPALQP